MVSRHRLREHGGVAVPERVRELLKEFAEVQARPISDSALVERMRTEATTWINAAHMQHQRATRPLIDPDAPGDEIWRQEIDLHFLLVALTRLRRAVGLATRVEGLQGALIDYLLEFDRDVPSLTTLRNVAEHFDDYTTGKGLATQVKRHQLQVWSLDEDADQGLVWRWLGVEFAVDNAHQAATQLYRRFLAAADEYLSWPHR
jgi:hypothetical protein